MCLAPRGVFLRTTCFSNVAQAPGGPLEVGAGVCSAQRHGNDRGRRAIPAALYPLKCANFNWQKCAIFDWNWHRPSFRHVPHFLARRVVGDLHGRQLGRTYSPARVGLCGIVRIWASPAADRTVFPLVCRPYAGPGKWYLAQPLKRPGTTRRSTGHFAEGLSWVGMLSAGRTRRARRETLCKRNMVYQLDRVDGLHR